MLRIHNLGSYLFQNRSLISADSLGDHSGDSQIHHMESGKDAGIDLFTDTDNHRITVMDPDFLQDFHTQLIRYICVFRVLPQLLYLAFTAVHHDHFFSGLRQAQGQSRTETPQAYNPIGCRFFCSLILSCQFHTMLSSIVSAAIRRKPSQLLHFPL